MLISVLGNKAVLDSVQPAMKNAKQMKLAVAHCARQKIWWFVFSKFTTIKAINNYK